MSAWPTAMVAALLGAGAVLAQVPPGPGGAESARHAAPARPAGASQAAAAAQDATSAHDAAVAQDATPPSAKVERGAIPGEIDTQPDAAPQLAWPGTVAEGFAEMRALAEKQQLESARRVADALLAPNEFLAWKLGVEQRGGWRARAVGLADPLLDLAGWNGLDPDARAEVWYAKGVIASLDDARDEAEDAFWKARGMSSDPTLRRDAIYDVGVLALQAGEAARAKIPEISGQPPQAATSAPAPGAPPGSAQAPDPLEEARAAYLQARERFVERLASGWQDADTQANVELCLKRLRELDEIERKRKEEEEKKKQEQQKQEQQDKDEKKQDEQDQQDKKQKQDQDPGRDDPQKQDEQQDPQKKDEEKKPEPPKPEDAKPDEAKKDEKKDAQPTKADENEMGEAEMTQLLDRLQRLEEEARRIQAQLKAARRAKVKKDW